MPEWRESTFLVYLVGAASLAVAIATPIVAARRNEWCIERSAVCYGADCYSKQGEQDMKSTAYERFAGTCAILAAIGGIAYGVAFVVLGNKLLYSVLLMLGGLASVIVLVALYRRLREVDDSLVLLALLVGVVGAPGAVGDRGGGLGGG